MQEPQEMLIRSLNWEDPLEKGTTAYTSILALWIPWTEEPGWLQSTGSQSQTQLKQLNTQFTHVTKVKVKVKIPQSCRTLCDPMAYTVHGILQARILEWVAFPFSRGSSHSSLKLSGNRKTYNHFSKIHMHIRIILQFFEKYKCPGFCFFFFFFSPKIQMWFWTSRTLW